MLVINWREDEEIKGVYIATPVSTHFKFIKLAIEHKKLVFCEKMYFVCCSLVDIFSTFLYKGCISCEHI